MKNKNSVFVFVFLLLLAASYVYSFQKNAGKENEAAIKEQTKKFVEQNLVQPGTEVEIDESKKEGGLYKLTLSVSGQKIETYVTEDGKKFFPQAIDLDKAADPQTASSAPAPVTEAAVKKDVPEVDLFVMSYCPYGVQAEKGILPVVEKLGSKIKFNLRFVDYILHGKQEFDENLNQSCIQKEEPAKLNAYLTCFAKEGDAEKCATTAKINKSKISTCISQSVEKFDDKSKTPSFGVDSKLNDKYGVQGSPTLVINGTLLDSGRDSASYLKAICSGFSDQPEECAASLPSETPTPGFGDGKTANANAASCGQ
ncbi:MAG: hypothetical protein UX75_C0004G0030 [Candidatus Moranbacteria bacterium GW2011_GWE2_47_10]|nr:MAG: hypothetical protein UX75_C0004G0030 [Candidatus Moranbacteria bacterium GW2011_GWE2_47_10]